MKALFPHKTVIIINGNEGTGKSLLAERLAVGRTLTTDWDLFKDDHRFNSILDNKLNTVIVEEVPINEGTLTKMKELTTNTKMLITRLGSEPKLINPPNFIFITGELEFIKIQHQDRRFMILTVE